MDRGESYEEAPNYDLALAIREPRDPNSPSKGASLGRFGRLLQHACRLVSKYGEPATGSDVHASATGNEAPQLLFRRVWPVSHRGRRHCCAAINQVENSPPEWKQSAEGYSKRFRSDFGIAAVTTTTRYALSEAFHEDTLYYRCECKGVFRRLSHAVISTFTARRGDDGHRVFSFPDLVAPYAGTMTAVYGWYPGRYNYKDAFRMGNYNVLLSAGANVSLEFLYSGPHSWLSRMHLNDAHGAPNP